MATWDTDEDAPIDFRHIHVVKGAAKPPHTNLGAIAVTNRWTLRVIIAGRFEHPNVTHMVTPSGKPFTVIDSLYYDN